MSEADRNKDQPDDMNPKRRTRRRPMGAGARMADIARLAGVSAITVSRTINHPEQVSAETRQRVEAAMDEAAYLPNMVAGSLASRKSRVVGVVVPTITNSLFADTVEGITDQLEPAGYQLMIASSRYSPETETDLVTAFLARQAEAVILTGTTHDERTLKLLKRADIPVFEMWNVVDEPIDTVVGFSNFEAGRRMTHFLADKGYRAIGFIGGPVERNDRTGGREAGYLAALEDLGYPVLADCMIRTAFDFRNGAAAIRTLLDRCPHLDAVFAASDVLAVGAVFECQRQGWPVPERIAIAGLDDSVIASEVSPPLTTIRLPRYEIGQVVGQEVLRRLDGHPRTRPVIDLGFEIIERTSA